MERKLIKVEEDLKKRLSDYYGRSIDSVAEMAGLNSELIGGKNSTVSVVNGMLKESGVELIHYKSILKSHEIIFKTVKLKSNHTPKESMSFERINFQTLVKETWLQSDIRKKFTRTVICFVVFKEIKGKLIFIGIKLWKMPSELLNNDVKQFWLKARNIVKSGVEITAVNRGEKIIYANNLPGSKDNKVMHIRPKAKDSNDKEVLPCGQLITKQAYWFNSSFIAELLSDMPDVYREEKIRKKSSSKIDIELLHSSLNEDVHAIKDIIDKLKIKNPQLNEFDINTDILKGTKYIINPPFIHKKSIKDIDKYIDKIIFSKPYLNLENNGFFEIPYVQRRINNYENALKLLKIGRKLYITEKGMENAGVLVKELKGYIKAVERFKKTDEFFTLISLSNEGFSHPVEDYGFELIFYESLLKLPNNKIQYFIVNKENIFVKSKEKRTLEHILRRLMRKMDYITVYDFMEYFSKDLSIKLDYDTSKRILKNTKFYYSEELDRLFKSKNAYLNYLY